MAQIVKLRRSSVSGQKPTNSNLQLGELALNTTDGKVFMAVSGSGGPSVQELVSTNTVNTGSIHITDNVTSSFFTGSFIGDGSQLYNIPSTGVTGLELNKIISGSVSASISPNRGLEINTKTTITGSLTLMPTTDPDPNGVTTTATHLFVSSSNNQTGEDLYLRQNDNLVKWKWVEGKLNSGILWGGDITTSGSLIYIKKGAGILINHRASLTNEISPLTSYVNWNDITASATYLTSSLGSYVGINSSGSLYQQPTFFTIEQYKSTIPLGMINHTGKNVITSVSSDVTTAYDDVNQTTAFIRAFGPIKLSGLELSPQSGNLEIIIGHGESYILGGFYQQDPNNTSHKQTPTISTPQIARVRRDGNGSHIVDNNGGAFYTTIDTSHWDDGTGTLNTLSGGSYTIHRVFFNPFTTRVHVYYGQNEYNTIALAQANIAVESFVEAEYSTHQYVLVGYILAKGGTTDLSNTNDCKIIQSGLFRNTVGSTGGAQTLTHFADLSDIDVSNALNGDLLVYDSSLNKWVDSKQLGGNYQITGSLFSSGPLNIGEIPIYGDINNPEIVHIYNSGSYNGIVALGDSETFYQTYIANINSGSNASTDLIIGADNVSDEAHYVDLGINSSNYNAGYVGYENDSYLYAASNDLYIGTLGISNGHADVHIFTSNSWANPQLTVSGSGQIGFNTPLITDGYQYEFSGSIKALHELSVGGSVSASYFTGNHIGDGSGLYNIPASGVTGLELNKIVDGSVSASISNGALRVNSDVFVAGVLTARELHTELVTSSVLYESGSTKFGNSLDDTHTFSGSILVEGLIETNRIAPVSGVDVTIESSNLKVPNGGIYTDFNVVSKEIISATSISGNTITGSLISGSFIGDATNLINVPFHITGSDVDGNTYDKTFTKLHFDDSTGLNVSESVAGTAFISIGSHFKDIFVSGSPVLSATGSDAFEIIGLGGIHISSSTVDTNGNGYVKELTFDLTEISSSLDSRITALTGSTGGGIDDGGYATLNQTTLAATWSFNHNLGQRYPIVQVFDSTGKVMIPSEVIMVNSSTTTITFPSAQSGKAVASLGTGPGGMTQFFTSATTWSLQHDMGADYPIVTVYDTNKNIIMPDRITSIDSNNIEVGFTTPVAGHLNVAKGGHIISGSINFSNISTAGSGIVSSSVQVYNYGYATTGSNSFGGSQVIKNAKIDATCMSVSAGTTPIFSISSYHGATFDYVVKNGSNMRAGTIVGVWDGTNSKYTETATPDLGDTSNVTFNVTGLGVLNAVVSSGTWTIEAMYRALNCS